MLGERGSLRGRPVANKAPGGIGPTQTCVGSSLKKRPCVAATALCKWMALGDTVTMLTVSGKLLRCFFEQRCCMKWNNEALKYLHCVAVEQTYVTCKCVEEGGIMT